MRLPALIATCVVAPLAAAADPKPADPPKPAVITQVRHEPARPKPEPTGGACRQETGDASGDASGEATGEAAGEPTGVAPAGDASGLASSVAAGAVGWAVVG